MCPSPSAPWQVCLFSVLLVTTGPACRTGFMTLGLSVHVQTHQICVVPLENSHGLMCMSSHSLYTPGTHHTCHLNQDDHHSLCSNDRYAHMYVHIASMHGLIKQILDLLSSPNSFPWCIEHDCTLFQSVDTVCHLSFCQKCQWTCPQEQGTHECICLWTSLQYIHSNATE